MTLKVVSNALIVTSSLTVAEVEAARVYGRDLLTVCDEDGNDVYTIGTGSAALTPYGATFNGHTGENKNLTASIIIPQQEDKDATKKFVKETYGEAMVNLAEAENLIKAAIGDKLDTINGTFSDMTVE